MGDWRRHAIYFAPPAGSPLAEFGADWLGWDPATGARARWLRPAGAAAAGGPNWSRRRARYGFHATLKAPFRLGPGRDAAALDAAAAAVAAGFAGFEVGLRLAALGRFVALVPERAGAAARRARSRPA